MRDVVRLYVDLGRAAAVHVLCAALRWIGGPR